MKKIMAKTGSYTNAQGEQKNNWTRIGVIKTNDKGEYLLLDPTVNLAGVMLKQQANSDRVIHNVMCSVFTDDNDRQPQQQAQQLSDDIPF